MKIKFIPAKENKLNEALDIFKLASLSLADKKIKQWNYWADPPEEKINWVKEGFAKGEFFFVHNLEGEKIAMFRLLETDTLYWNEKGTEKNVRYIHSLVVIPAYGRQGIGKLVLYRIIDQLKKENIKKLRLDCDGSNPRLCQYYEGFGFLKVGEKRTNYAVNNLYELTLS